MKWTTTRRPNLSAVHWRLYKKRVQNLSQHTEVLQKKSPQKNKSKGRATNAKSKTTQKGQQTPVDSIPVWVPRQFNYIFAIIFNTLKCRYPRPGQVWRQFRKQTTFNTNLWGRDAFRWPHLSACRICLCAVAIPSSPASGTAAAYFLYFIGPVVGRC